MSNSSNLLMGRMLVLLIFFSVGFAQFMFADSIRVPETRFLEDVTLFPQKLSLEGDSVRFTVSGSIPIESVLTPKNPRISLSLKGENVQRDLGPLELKKNVSNYTYSGSYSLKYEAWMASGSLEVFFFQGKKENTQASERRVLAKGVIAPQLMVKLGAVYPDEPIPLIGLFITAGLPDREMVRVREFSFVFEPGSASYKPSTANQAVLNAIDSFLDANPELQQVRITGIQSPEQSEGKSSALGMNRAEAAQKALGNRLGPLSPAQVRLDGRRNDWFDLRLLLRDYKGISNTRKEELYTILMNQETYLEQSERLKKVPGYSQVAQDLYPQLRVAKVEITAKPRSGLDMNQSMRLKTALTSSDGTNDLTLAEWTLAAESTQSLEEKAAIYSKMTEFFRSALPYNNMAVVRIRQAQRTLDQGSKEVLWEEAQRLLTQAIRIESNPYSLHNMGQILALQGNYWDAYLKLSTASSMTKDPDFVLNNEALKGALDIVRGDYKLATLRFEYDFSDPKDYFNKGLAYYLIQDYANATIAFEESVEHGRQFGYGFYGLAMIAAAGGQREVAQIHLNKAIEANRQLADRAYQDPLFQELLESETFLP